MFGPWWLDLGHGWISASYVALLAGVWYAPRPLVRLVLLGAIVIASLWAWLSAYRRYHLITDTPSSAIRSAAQGYTELYGRCELHPGTLPIGFRSGPPCVWYRYKVHRQSGSPWTPHSHGQSTDTFVLSDATGQCVIDPDAAEVVTTHRSRWREGDFWLDVEYLAPGDNLYALGDIVSIGHHRTPTERSHEVSLLLREWKHDREGLTKRFDSDGDGQINLQEWNQARGAAEDQVDRECIDRPIDSLLMRSPEGRRPYLLSNRDPKDLATRYQRWSWLHAIVFAGTSVATLVCRFS
ncbi:MAG: hypothetical protein USCGTAYLOR_00631 [Chromatiales bacterium USCg_Taylor]|jgi:hypothetical protein|nr:MAG: hypothetical protein USCGTAYLOR_00631 [Chromatiales bacterium USCg_Taylor]